MLGDCVCIASEELCRNIVSAAINSVKADAIMLTSFTASLITPESVPDMREIHLVGGKLHPSTLIHGRTEPNLLLDMAPQSAQ